MSTTADRLLGGVIPEPDEIRLRLAVLTTEAGLLRKQLRVSRQLAQERERLKADLRRESGEVSHGK